MGSADIEWIEDASSQLDMAEESMAEGMDGVTPEYSVTDPAIIKYTWMNIVTTDPIVAAEAATEIAEAADGRVEHRSINRGEGGDASSASLALRVPSTDLTEVIDQLAALGQVTHESTDSSDVTAQHVDLSARVKSITSSINHLEALLDQAESVSDLIEIESALSERQADLDSLSAQLEMMDSAIDYSSIQLELSSQALPFDQGDQSFWQAIVMGFWSVLAVIQTLFIWFGYAIPWIATLLVISLFVWISIRVLRKRKTRR